MNLPEGLIALLRQPSLCFLATVMPDGSPHVTQTWGDTDGEHVVINSVRDHQKVKNVERDPRVAVNVGDVSSPSRYGGRDQVRVILTIEAARIGP